MFQWKLSNMEKYMTTSTSISASSIFDVYPNYINLSFFILFLNSDSEGASGTVTKKTLQKFIFSATLTLPKSFKRKGKEKKITKGEALGTVYLRISHWVNYERLLCCFLENNYLRTYTCFLRFAPTKG